MNIKEKAEEGMQAAITHLKDELKNIRTGRANPGILDSVFVEVYGTQMRIKDIASVTVPEPRQLLITPFDKQNISSIGKAIEKANLGFQVITEGDVVRINIPQMDEQARNDMIRRCHDRKEEAKVSVRHVRAQYNKQVREEKSGGSISEDEMKKLEKVIQDLTDKYCDVAEKVCQEKEKEISTI